MEVKKKAGMKADDGAWFAMLCAIATEDMSGLKKAMESGADADRRDIEGLDAMGMCAMSSRPEMAKYLLDYVGSCPEACYGWDSAVSNALKASDIQWIEKLARKGYPLEKIFLEAIGQKADEDLLRFICGLGDLVPETFSRGLGKACDAGGGNALAARFCLGKGADPDWVDEHGMTLIESAVFSNAEEIVGALLGAGADVRKIAKSGLTVIEHIRSWELSNAAADALFGAVESANQKKVLSEVVPQKQRGAGAVRPKSI